MKIKAKITSTIMSMMLALGVMGFAVYAAATQTLTVNNTVSFVSDHVLARITGDVAGATGGNQIDPEALDYDKSVTSSNDVSNAFPEWEIGDVEFAAETAPITITINIYNLSKERSLTFSLETLDGSLWNGANLGEDSNSNITRSVKYSTTNQTPATNETYVSGDVEVEKEKQATILISLNITDTGRNVNDFDNSFNLELNNVGEGNGGGGEFEGPVVDQEKPGTEGLDFVLDEVSGGYLFSGLGTSTETDIVIPRTYNGQPVVGFYEGGQFGPPALYGAEIDSLYIPRTVKNITNLAQGATIGTVYFEGGTSNEDRSSLEVLDGNSFQSSTIDKIVFGNYSGLTSFQNQSWASVRSIDFSETSILSNLGSIKGLNTEAFIVPSTVNSFVSMVVSTITNLYFVSNSNLQTLTIAGGNSIENLYIADLPNLAEIDINSGVSGIKKIDILNFAQNATITGLQAPLGQSEFYIRTDKFLAHKSGGELMNAGYTTFYVTTAMLNTYISTWLAYPWMPSGNPLVTADNFQPIPAGNTQPVFGEAYNPPPVIVVPKLNYNFDSDLNGYVVTGYGTYNLEENNGALEIPATYKGSEGEYPVVKIEDYAFNELYDLISVTFPENSAVVEFGEYAFAGTSLTTITLPESLKVLSEGAFVNIYTLTEVVFGENSQLERIGKSVFNGTSIASVHIPNSVKVIESNAFSVSTLTNVTFEASSQLELIKNRAFVGVFEEFVFPDSAELVIEDEVFFFTLIQNVVLSNVNFKGNPFAGSVIGSIEIPAGLPFVKENSFLYKTNEDGQKIELIGHVYEHGDLSGLDTNNFEHLSLAEMKHQIENLTLPSTLTTIHPRALTYVEVVTFTVPANVTIMSTYSFPSSADEVIFEENSLLTEFMPYLNEYQTPAAASWMTVKKITFGIGSQFSVLKAYDLSFNNLNSINLEILENLTEIHGWLFETSSYGFQSSLTTLILPTSVARIYPLAFAGSPSSLTSITLPSGLTVYEEFYNGEFVEYHPTENVIDNSNVNAYLFGYERQGVIINFHPAG